MKKPYVFISYSTKDAEAANLVYSYLEGSGISCWIATQNIEGGDSFAADIVDAISDCSAFVMISSVNSDDSPHVSSELTLAFSQKKKIIPLRLANYEVSKKNLYFLAHAQWIDAFENMNVALKRMLHAIQLEFYGADVVSSATPVKKSVTKAKKKADNEKPIDDLPDMTREKIQMTKELILGLGGTGVRIVSKVAMEIAKKDINADGKKVSCAVIDTNVWDIHHLKDRNVDVFCLNLSKDKKIEDYINNYKEDGVEEWMPMSIYSGCQSMADGAGQMRTKARLAFYDCVKDGTIRELEKEIDKLIFNLNGENVRVTIVSSLAGGTGSGILIQVAMWIRKYFENQQISVSISGILILPDVFIRTIAQIGHDEAECRVLRANAYATIREINAISKSKTASPKLFDTIKLDEVGYSSDNGLGDKPVFDRTYLIDYEAKTGGAFMSIADYEKTVARIAYMQLFPPLFGNTNSMEDTIYKRFQIANDPLYGSCGTAKAKYPADSVLKYCSLRAAKDTLFAGWQRIDERISARQRKEAEHEENSSAVKKCINPRAEYVRMFDELSSKTSDEIDQNRLFVNIAADVSNEKYVPKDDGTEIIESNDKVEDFITTLQGLIDKDISNVDPGNISQLKIQQDCEAWVESDACSKGDDLKVFVANQAKMVQRFLADINYRLEEIAENVVNIVCPNDMGDVDEANLASIKGMFTKTDENGESYFIHPIAVRYILYKLADLLEGYKNESIVDEAREAVIKGPEMTLDNKKTTIVTRITLPEFIEDKPFFISKKKHIKNVKRVYYDYNSQYTDLCSDFAKKLVMQKVAMLLAQRIEVLTKVVENFFGNLDQVYDKLNNDIAANIEENNENANKIFYVFASGEEKEYLYESLNLDTGNSDKSINKTIVDAFYAQFCVKDNQIARNNIKYEKQSVIATFFTELLNTYGDIIKNDCNDKIDLDLYTAVCKSSDFEYKRENGDAEEDSNSRAKRHMKAMKDWVARVQSNSSPYLLVKDDIKSNPSKQTTFWGFSPDLAKACPELGQILGVNTETQQNKAYDKCELDCYRAVYGIEAGEVDKFNEERKQERDNYYGSYEYIVSTMDEKVANGDEEALVMTPHLDKTWHKILPFISPDKKD